MSWLGPLVFGVAYQLTGSYRDAIISLVVFFVIGFRAARAGTGTRAIGRRGEPRSREDLALEAKGR